MGKKRKVELDLDMERTMYSSFVTAANAVSQLYTQGVQQQRRAAAAASKATLVRLGSVPRCYSWPLTTAVPVPDLPCLCFAGESGHVCASAERGQ